MERTHHRLIHLMVALCAVAASSPLAAKDTPRDPLTLTLSAHVVPENAQVSARIRVEPDPRSRSLTVEWWSEEGAGGSHTIDLDGERAAAQHTYPIKHMEAGEYTVSAVLIRNDGSVVKKQQRVVVAG